MFLHYEINTATNLAIITAEGNYDVPALIEMMKAVSEDSSFNSKTNIVIDKTQVTNLPSNEEARNLAIGQGNVFKGHKVVTIAKQPTLFGVNRMISTLSENKGCQSTVFKTFGEALNWLV